MSESGNNYAQVAHFFFFGASDSQAAKTQAQEEKADRLAQQVQSLPKLNFACIPPAANVLDDHHAAAVRQVQQNAVVVEAPNMIVSNGVEGSRRRALDARAAGHLVRRPRQRT